MRPPGGGWRGLFRGLSGARGRGLSEAPGGGLQLSSAGIVRAISAKQNSY